MDDYTYSVVSCVALGTAFTAIPMGIATAAISFNVNWLYLSLVGVAFLL